MKRICGVEALESRQLLAWDAFFSAGALTVQTPEPGDTGVLIVEVGTGNILLDKDNSGTFRPTGANVNSLTGPVQINAGTAPDTNFIIDNELGDFFAGVGFAYDGGTAAAGVNDRLTVRGRSDMDDLFALADVVTIPGSPGNPPFIPPTPPDSSGTLAVTNTLGTATINYTRLRGDPRGAVVTLGTLALDSLAGNDLLMVDGTTGDETFTIDVAAVAGSGGNITYVGFENLAVNGLEGVDTITVDGTSVDTAVDSGPGGDLVTVNAPLALPLGIDAGLDTDTLVVNGTTGNDGFFIDQSTIRGVGADIGYTVGSVEILEVGGLDGDDDFTLQFPIRFRPPFPNEFLPATVRFYGDSTPTVPAAFGSNHLRVLGNDPLANLTQGNDIITVGDGNSGEPIEMFDLDCVVIFGFGGDDTLENSSTGAPSFGIPPIPSMIIGGAGNDILTGGEGNDILLGGDGVDILSGMDGDDYLFPDQDEFGFIYDLGGEDIDAGDGTDTGVVGMKDQLFAGDYDGRDTISGFNDNAFERVVPTVDPQRPTAHLYEVTPALLFLEEAFNTACPVKEFGANRNLRGQFALYQAFVGRAYRDILKRDIGAPELAFWTGPGRRAIELVQAEIFASNEYRDRTGTLNERFVRSIFTDVLGRLPDNDEITHFVGLLNNGVPRASVALEFLLGPEPRNVLINEMYTQFFPGNVSPSSADRTAILADLAAGFPLDQLALELFRSGGAYFNYVVANNIGEVGFVGGLYRDVLQRGNNFSINEVVFWTSQIANRSTNREQIASFFLHSTEKRALLIDGYYRTFLGRGADQGGLNFWLGRMAAAARDEEVLAGILSSDEYFTSQGRTSDGFVRALYRELLERGVAPTQAEVDFWIAQLAVSPRGEVAARGDVVLSFQASEEYRTLLIHQWHQIYLGRNANAAEIDSFLELLRSGVTHEQAQLVILLSR